MARLNAQLHTTNDSLAKTRAVVDGMRAEVALATGKRMAAAAAAAAADRTRQAAESKAAAATKCAEEVGTALADLRLVEGALRARLNAELADNKELRDLYYRCSVGCGGAAGRGGGGRSP